MSTWTAETQVGTYLDGKPVYQRTITVNANSVSTYINDDCNTESIFFTSGTYVDVKSNQYVTVLIKDRNLYLNVSSTHKSCSVIIMYTKIRN